MSEQTFPMLERPAFFNGQRLTAADLTAVQTFHRELRWLHNRSLHSWGIAFGCAVSGQKGDRTVSVEPGYALDCKGRDLILSEKTTLAIPSTASAKTYYLTLSYAEDSDITPETRQGTCGTSGAVRRAEKPLVRWQDPTDSSAADPFTHGIDIVLASVAVANCQLTADVSSAERRDAVPATQPYIAAGQTAAGSTVWTLWPPPPEDGDPTFVGVSTEVSTTSAGFGGVPRYQAHVVGDRMLSITPDGDDVSVSLVVEGYAQVAKMTAASFELQVILPPALIGSGLVMNPPGLFNSPELLNFVNANWSVVWMGIEG